MDFQQFRLECVPQKENPDLYLKTPLESETPSFSQLVNYFQYHAPFIDSIHAAPPFPPETEREALQKILSAAGMKLDENCRFPQRIRSEMLEKLCLDGEELCFQCPRMICRCQEKRKNQSAETELPALLRHLRNAFAHGRTYMKSVEGQSYIYLADYNSKKLPSAKIVVTRSILEQWKAILEGYIT